MSHPFYLIMIIIFNYTNSRFLIQLEFAKCCLSVETVRQCSAAPPSPCIRLRRVNCQHSYGESGLTLARHTIPPYTAHFELLRNYDTLLPRKLPIEATFETNSSCDERCKSQTAICSQISFVASAAYPDSGEHVNGQRTHSQSTCGARSQSTCGERCIPGQRRASHSAVRRAQATVHVDIENGYQ